MRQQITVALIIAGMAVPGFAQRGGGRGGFSGGGARGGFSGGGVRSGGIPMSSGQSFSAPAGYRGAPTGYGGYGSVAQRGAVARSGALRMSPGAPFARSGYAGVRQGPFGVNAGARRGVGRYPERHRNVYPYPYGVSAWVAPSYLEYGDPGFYDDGLYYEGSDEPYDSASPVNSSAASTYVDAPPPPEDQDLQGVDTSGKPQPAPKAEASVTLIFKDGRPPETIHNYMLTQTELMVIKGQRQYEIPVAELDVAATEQVNKAAGVAFQLPHVMP